MRALSWEGVHAHADDGAILADARSDLVAQGPPMKRTRSRRVQYELNKCLQEWSEASNALYTLKNVAFNPYFDWQSVQHAHQDHVVAGLILDLQDWAY